MGQKLNSTVALSLTRSFLLWLIKLDAKCIFLSLPKVRKYCPSNFGLIKLQQVQSQKVLFFPYRTIAFQSRNISMPRLACKLGWKGTSEDTHQPNSLTILADLVTIKSSRKKYIEVRWKEKFKITIVWQWKGKSESHWPLSTIPASLGVNWKWLFTMWPLILLINRHWLDLEWIFGAIL